MRIAFTKNQKITLSITAVIAILLCCLAVFLTFYLPLGDVIFSSAAFKEKKAERFAEAAATTPKGSTIFTGDSLIEMYDLDRYYPQKGYINTGISGNRIYELNKRIESNILVTNPSKIVINIGVNDLREGRTIADIMNDYEELYNIVTEYNKDNNPDCKVFIMSPSPVRNLNNWLSRMAVKITDNSLIDDFASEVKAFTEAKGWIYLNTSPLVKADDGMLNINYTVEGIHYNHNGYMVISEYIGKVLDNN